MGRTAETPPGHFVVGTIRYKDVDASPYAENGTVYYVKPIVSGDESVDVLNYAAAHKDFPHESTADQWFDEDQFETYRTLGLHTAKPMAP